MLRGRMEKLYHYLWKYKIAGTDLVDVDGKRIEILDPGIHNNDAGPDFFNAKLKIDGTEWAGNVEIHLKASDWMRHGHSSDRAYDNVILHVVAVSDKRISRRGSEYIPQLEMTLPEKFFRTIAALTDEIDAVRCGGMIGQTPELNLEDWLESLSVERLEQKARKVIELKESTGGDWEQTCFIMLARGFGFGLNGDPFEMLAKSIPLRILHHHSDNMMQLEALLFGQSSMLDPTQYLFDEYYQTLCREYFFLAKKYDLKPMRPGLWKYSRTRPQNFPHRRIAFLASATKDGFSLFSKLLETGKKGGMLSELFNMKAEGYWSTHYSFDSKTGSAPADMSSSGKNLLAINVAAPILYAYAHFTGDLLLGENVRAMMTDFPPENNSILREWKTLGLEAENASRSQALIHLRKEYCDKKKCLYCRLGNLYLRKVANEDTA